MITFLFWNLNKQPRPDVVARLVYRHAVDVVILAEWAEPVALLTDALSQQCRVAFEPVGSVDHRLLTLTRLSPSGLVSVADHDRVRFLHLLIPPHDPVLLACVHLPSKLHWSDRSQTAECVELARLIGDEERRQGHKRTVLVGDLNMDPFEDGVIQANGLHAARTRRLAQRESRIVQGREWPFFYNPMWGHLGDCQGGPPGTYYYESAEHVTMFWHAFDQVLIRPHLLPIFRNETLQVLTDDGTVSFLGGRGTPDPKVASDHLPIVFSLDL